MGDKRSLVSLDQQFLPEPVDLSPLSKQIQGFGNKLDEKQKSLASLAAPFSVRENDLKDMVRIARELSANSDAVVVLGSGFTSQAARCALEALTPAGRMEGTEVIFAGGHFSPHYYLSLIQQLSTKKFSVIVVTAGEASFELRASLRLMYTALRQRFGADECQRRLVFCAPSTERVLQGLATEYGFRVIRLPDKFQSPYLAFSPIALLPLACREVDVEQFLDGGRSLARSMDKQSFEENHCFQFAALREVLTSDGRTECLCVPDPRLSGLGRWWRHLMNMTHALLHPQNNFPSEFLHLENRYLGQSQWDEGCKWWETHLWVSQVDGSLPMDCPEMEVDGLTDFAQHDFAEISNQMLDRLQTEQAGRSIPQVRLTIPKLDAYGVGALLCFLETAANVNQKLTEITPPAEAGAFINASAEALT